MDHNPNQHSKSQVQIMGILNVTPDSFSDGGKFNTVDQAISRAEQMIEEGADIIDIGGESTRPGAMKVTLEEELSRVIPVIQALTKRIHIPISIDTYKAKVADQAMQVGASIINDVWGGIADREIWNVVKQYQCPYVLTHQSLYPAYSSVHFIEEMVSELQDSLHQILDTGVQKHQIILDPGIGFAKNYQQNLKVLHHIEQIVQLGYPVLLGTSRKSVIRNTLQLPADDVIEGTAATVAIGIYKGCSIIRVHDVKAMKRVAVMTKAIINSD
jgi:dihydropteroate synthase